MIKLVKTGPDGLIEDSHPEPRTPADRSIRPTRKASSHDRPRFIGQNIHPSDPVGRTRKLSATIVPTVPIADHDPIAGRPSRPTVRTVRSTRSLFHTFSRPGLT
ncbi:unnamed protein product [Microthlaspi erraticum]|uniref:Uncharacterized protein n=1 Tax=Microthlaspi erraticum TaxID=1685480 RepID=A0A6D2IK10_9BRAS|nr:unnamed protein product [Microthlaspi erraticum]